MTDIRKKFRKRKKKKKNPNMTLGYFKVLEKIKEASLLSGRKPDDIKLVVVSKTQPINTIRDIYNLGHRCFAENKIQEAVEKIDLLPPDIEWHLIGHLQTNKAKKAADIFNTVQSIDSEKIARQINNCALKINKVMQCLVEVKISYEETKYGVEYNLVIPLIKNLSNIENIRICGLMGMAPFTDNTEEIRKSFRKLKTLYDELKNLNIPNTDMKWLSMGMSSDFEVAIQEGSNMVRIGTAVFRNEI